MKSEEILSKYGVQIQQALRREKNSEKPTFNFFTSISDYYYRENFHSDIIKTLLEIPEFFEVFFNELSIHLGYSIKFNFNSTIIERERHGRIDISIIDQDINQAIIIENKINDAIDMYRQLPRYFDNLIEKKIEVINIVYLSLNGNKNPSKNGWSIFDDLNLKNRITLMSGIERDNFFTLEGVIKKSIINTNSIDQIVFQRQYINLLNKLSRQEIRYNIMNELYSKIETKNDLDQLLTLKKLINDLPKYRAMKIRERFKDNPNPFSEVLIWKDYTAYFNKLLFENSNFALDIDCFETYYDVSFFDRNAQTNETASNFIIKASLDLTPRDNSTRLFKSFQYPEQEKEMYSFIAKAMKEIGKLLS